MAHAKEEVADMAGMPLPTTEFVDAMLLAAKSANKKGIPAIWDVCGEGAEKLRDEKGSGFSACICIIINRNGKAYIP